MRTIRCGLLLPMFCVGLSACLSVGHHSEAGVNPAETNKPIDVPFGMWTRVGPRNYVLGGGSLITSWREARFRGGHT